MTGKALLLHVLVKKTSWSIAFEIDATTLIISRYKHITPTMGKQEHTNALLHCIAIVITCPLK